MEWFDVDVYKAMSDFEILGKLRLKARPYQLASYEGESKYLSLFQGLENGDAESAGIGPIFEESTSHLAAKDAVFMRQWLRAIALEEEGLIGRRANMWTMSGSCLFNNPACQE